MKTRFRMPRVGWIVLGLMVALSCGIGTREAKASSTTTPNFSGYVWYDTNGNGYKDYNESTVANVMVIPQKETSTDTWEDRIALATYTDANGNYNIRLNEEGNWRLRFINPDVSRYLPTRYRYDSNPYSQTASQLIDPTTQSDKSGVTDRYVFTGNAYGGSMNTYAGVNAGWMPTSFAVSGFAFLESETEINHYYNEGSDYLLKNVTVTLCDVNGNPISGVSPTRTNDSGKYEIKGLQKNTQYKLRFDLPSNSAFSFVSPYASRYNGSINGKVDSKAIPSTTDPNIAFSDVITVGSVDLNDYSVGCYAHNYISGVVWEDKTQDGRKDDSEPVISGMEIQVLKSDLSTYVDSNNQFYVVKTNTNGRYVIAGLPAGGYKLVFKKRSTADTFTTKSKDGVPDALSSKVNADGLTDIISVYTIGGNTAPQRIANINAGVFTAGSTPMPNITATATPTPTPNPANPTPIPSFDDGEFEEMEKTGEDALPIVLSVGGGMILLGVAVLLLWRKKRYN